MFADEDFQPYLGDFQSQYEILESYVDICYNLKLTPLVKFHPRNPKKVFLQDHSKENFSFKFVETFDDANTLIEASDLIVFSSSSLAIDAALINKPSCHCLPAFYEKASISFPTKNECSLRDFINSPFYLEGTNKRALILQKGFAASASLLEEKSFLTRFLKRVALGH